MNTTKYEISQETLDILQEMARKGAENASESLSKIINQTVNILTLQARILPIEEIGEMIGSSEDAVTSVVMGIGRDVRGAIMLIYPQQSALNVADMLQSRPLGSTHTLSESDISALKESGNIISGAFLSALSNYLNINMIESVPDIAQDMLKATINSVLAKFAKLTEAEAIAFEIDYNMGTGAKTAEKIVPEIKVNAYFVIILDIASTNKVIEAIKKISDKSPKE